MSFEVKGKSFTFILLMGKWTLKMNCFSKEWIMLLLLIAGFSFRLTAGDTIPKYYQCLRINEAILIDGRMDEAAWEMAPWSDSFVDIEGDKKPLPLFDTRFKMMWDDTCLYFYAELQEPHICAHLTKDESIIYLDNDFEVFLDPDGDHHNYFEFEINALGTRWDLMLNKPYHDQGKAITSWGIKGLQSAVYLNGSINDPSDTDSSWFVEIAMPWKSLMEFYGNKKYKPITGDFWRINFSRVQWDYDVIDGQYLKRRDPESGKVLPEHNWVWSPQGVINMHNPETWGYLLFEDVSLSTLPDDYHPDPDYRIKEELVRLYRLQKIYHQEHQHYAPTAEELEGANVSGHYDIDTGEKQYTIKIFSGHRAWFINQERKLWFEVQNIK